MTAVFSIVIAILFAVLSAVVLLEQFFHPIGSTTLVALGGEICAFSNCAETMGRYWHRGIARAKTKTRVNKILYANLFYLTGKFVFFINMCETYMFLAIFRGRF